MRPSDFFTTQSHTHPRGITLHRHIDEFPNVGEVDDLFDLGVDFLFREPEHGALRARLRQPLICIVPDAAPFGPTFGCSLIRSLPLISPCGLPGAVYRAASRAAWFYRLPSPSVRVRSKLD